MAKTTVKRRVSAFFVAASIFLPAAVACLEACRPVTFVDDGRPGAGLEGKTLMAARDEDVLVVAGERIAAQVVAEADFADAAAFESQWVLEGPAQASIADGKLLVDSIGRRTAATLWYRGEFEADLAIEYAGATVPPHGACNFNMFLHATELDGADVLFRPKTGAYNDYHKINNYIFTLTEKWSRFRRDPGFHCIAEDMEMHAEPGVRYHVVIIHQGRRLRAFVNDRLIHDVTDAEPHIRGRIALRTWNTALAYDTFRVWKLSEERHDFEQRGA